MGFLQAVERVNKRVSRCQERSNFVSFTDQHELEEALRDPELRASQDDLARQSRTFGNGDKFDVNGVCIEPGKGVLRFLKSIGIPIFSYKSGYGVVFSGSGARPKRPNETRKLGDDTVPISKDFDIFLVVNHADEETRKVLASALITQVKNAILVSGYSHTCSMCDRCKTRFKTIHTHGLPRVCTDEECLTAYENKHSVVFRDRVSREESPVYISSGLFHFKLDEICFEFVVSRVYEYPEGVIGSFDLPQCQFVYFQDEDVGKYKMVTTTTALFCLVNGVQLVSPKSSSNCMESRIKKETTRGFPIVWTPCDKLHAPITMQATRGLVYLTHITHRGIKEKDINAMMRRTCKVWEAEIPKELDWLYQPPVVTRKTKYSPFLRANGTLDPTRNYLKVGDELVVEYMLCDSAPRQNGSPPTSGSFSPGPESLYEKLWSVSLNSPFSNTGSTSDVMVSGPYQLAVQEEKEEEEAPEDTDPCADWVKTTGANINMVPYMRELAKELRKAKKNLESKISKDLYGGEGAQFNIAMDDCYSAVIHLYFKISVCDTQWVEIVVSLSGYRSKSSSPVICVRTENSIWSTGTVCMGTDSHYHANETTGGKDLVTLIQNIAQRFQQHSWGDVHGSVGFRNPEVPQRIAGTVRPGLFTSWVRDTEGFNRENLKRTMSLFA